MLFKTLTTVAAGLLVAGSPLTAGTDTTVPEPAATGEQLEAARITLAELVSAGSVDGECPIIAPEAAESILRAHGFEFEGVLSWSTSIDPGDAGSGGPSLPAVQCEGTTEIEVDTDDEVERVFRGITIMVSVSDLAADPTTSVDELLAHDEFPFKLDAATASADVNCWRSSEPGRSPICLLASLDDGLLVVGVGSGGFSPDTVDDDLMSASAALGAAVIAHLAGATISA